MVAHGHVSRFLGLHYRQLKIGSFWWVTICFGLQQRTVCNCKRAVCLRAKVWQFSAQKKIEDHPLIKTSADVAKNKSTNKIGNLFCWSIWQSTKKLYSVREGVKKKLEKSSQAESAWLTAWVDLIINIKKNIKLLKVRLRYIEMK